MANGTLRKLRTLCYVPFFGLQGAKAALRWTGSWYAALVAVDPWVRSTPLPNFSRRSLLISSPTAASDMTCWCRRPNTFRSTWH